MFQDSLRENRWYLLALLPLLVLTFIAFYNLPDFLSGNSIFAYAMLFYILTGTLAPLRRPAGEIGPVWGAYVTASASLDVV